MTDRTSDRQTPGTSGAGRSVKALDRSDRQILRELIRDARTSIRSLAEKVHISRANAYARIDRLVAEGVITGFSAQIAPERAGLGTSAYVSLSIEQNTWREVSTRLGQLPYVEHIAMLGADFDVLVLVRAPDNAALRDLVLDRIQGIPGVRTTRTWLVFAELPGPGPDWDIA